MTSYEIRERQRLLSDEDRQARKAIAEARRARLEREGRRRRWSYLILVIAAVIALAITIGLVIVGGAQVTVIGRGHS